MESREKLERAVQRSLRQFDAELDVLEQVAAAHLKLSRTDGRALEIIERRREGVTPGDLARDLGYTPSAATVVINRLEAAGLAERTLSTTDRRRLHVRPTEAGRKLVQGYFGQLGEQVTRLLIDMSDEELLAVNRFLTEMGATVAEYRSHLASVTRAGAPG
ncbi:MAG: MarR family winged helix-turn-helix transcriptional regulator [Candidatus Dormibacteria bacterium]